MPTDKRRDQRAALDYGASVASEHVDFAEGYNTATPGNRDRALIDKLKDALKPGDARWLPAEAEKPHHGGLLDELGGAREGSGGALDKLHSGQEGGGGVVDSAKKKKKGIAARLESYRDSTDTTTVDENRVPGNFYQTIRDDFGG